MAQTEITIKNRKTGKTTGKGTKFKDGTTAYYSDKSTSAQSKGVGKALAKQDIAKSKKRAEENFKKKKK